MRKLLIILFSVAIFSMAGKQAYGQTLKFGHINSDELVKSMPEYDTVLAQLGRLQKELGNTLEIMQVEFNNKYESYLKENKNLSDLVKQAKEQELQEISQRIQNFQAQAQSELQEKQATLSKPVFDKVDKAIKDVGKEGGFIYIFDVAKGDLLYFDETKSANILPQVKTKLGLK